MVVNLATDDALLWPNASSKRASSKSFGQEMPAPLASSAYYDPITFVYTRISLWTLINLIVVITIAVACSSPHAPCSVPDPSGAPPWSMQLSVSDSTQLLLRFFSSALERLQWKMFINQIRCCCSPSCRQLIIAKSVTARENLLY